MLENEGVKQPAREAALQRCARVFCWCEGQQAAGLQAIVMWRSRERMLFVSGHAVQEWAARLSCLRGEEKKGAKLVQADPPRTHPLSACLLF